MYVFDSVKAYLSIFIVIFVLSAMFLCAAPYYVAYRFVYRVIIVLRNAKMQRIFFLGYPGLLSCSIVHRYCILVLYFAIHY